MRLPSNTPGSFGLNHLDGRPEMAELVAVDRRLEGSSERSAPLPADWRATYARPHAPPTD